MEPMSPNHRATQSAANSHAHPSDHDDQLRQLIARQDQLVQNFGELVAQHEALAATHGALLADHAELKLAHEQLLSRLSVLEHQAANPPTVQLPPAEPQTFEMAQADREILAKASEEVGNISEFVTAFTKDVTNHLAAHDQSIIELQQASQLQLQSMATKEQLEEQARRIHHLARNLEDRLEDLASLPGTMSGLESRVERLSASSEAWLNELTALTADLSSRLSDQESHAWGISPVAPQPNQSS
jgi:chromosome segregation ATPase